MKRNWNKTYFKCFKTLICMVVTTCDLTVSLQCNGWNSFIFIFYFVYHGNNTYACLSKVNYTEERQNEPLFAPVVTTSSTPKRRPARLEPLIEEIESSDNTPSYELKEVFKQHSLFSYSARVIFV